MPISSINSYQEGNFFQPVSEDYSNTYAQIEQKISDLKTIEAHQYAQLVPREPSKPLNLWGKKLFDELSQDTLPNALMDAKQLIVEVGEKNALFLLLRAYEFIQKYYPHSSAKELLAQQLETFSAEDIRALPKDYIFEVADVSPAFVQELSSMNRNRLATLVKWCGLGILAVGAYYLARGGEINTSVIVRENAQEPKDAQFDTRLRGFELTTKCFENYGTLFIGNEPELWACIETDPEKNLLITLTKDYMGSSILDLINGNGTITYPNEDVYKGSYHKGNPEGQGTLTGSDVICRANFVDGQMNGEGNCTFSYGTSLEGSFLNGQFITGKQIDKEGTTLEGSFLNGKLITGKQIDKDGTILEGSFLNGKLITGKEIDKDEILVKNFVNGKRDVLRDINDRLQVLGKTLEGLYGIARDSAIKTIVKSSSSRNVIEQMDGSEAKPSL